jgi:hypothetical protein
VNAAEFKRRVAAATRRGVQNQHRLVGSSKAWGKSFPKERKPERPKQLELSMDSEETRKQERLERIDSLRRKKAKIENELVRIWKLGERNPELLDQSIEAARLLKEAELEYNILYCK